MTLSTVGVNPGSVPNSDSNTRSRSSWPPAWEKIGQLITNNNILADFRSILSSWFPGLVCRFLKTLEIDGMALWRSSISVLAREPAYAQNMIEMQIKIVVAPIKSYLCLQQLWETLLSLSSWCSFSLFCLMALCNNATGEVHMNHWQRIAPHSVDLLVVCL